MGEVGRVNPSGSERGEWDQSLFDRFRRAKGERRRHLLGSLIQTNEPLIIKLTAQLRGDDRGDGKARAVRFRGGSFGRVIESEKLEWEDSLNAGRIAFAKAMERFDPTRGSLPTYLKRKIFYELQALVGKTGILTVERGQRAAAFETFEDGDHMDRVLSSVSDLEDEGDPLDELEPAPFAATPFDAPARPPLDTRTALEVLLDEHLLFARHARCAETPLRARHRRLACSRGEGAPRVLLLEALRARDVRVTRMRVPWSDTPVDGFAGVSLQSCAHPRPLQSTDVGPCVATSQRRENPSSSYLPTGGYNGKNTREATQSGAAGVTAGADH